MADAERWKELSSTPIYENPWGKLISLKVELTDGTIIPDYVIWRFSDGVMIAGFTPEDELVLVQQYRLGPDDLVVELPAGSVDKKDVSEAAKSELKEEVGGIAEKLEHLGNFYVLPSRTSTKTYAFLAENLQLEDEQDLDVHEDWIRITKVPLEKLHKFILEGGINDAQSLATIFLALLKRGNIKIE